MTEEAAGIWGLVTETLLSLGEIVVMLPDLLAGAGTFLRATQFGDATVLFAVTIAWLIFINGLLLNILYTVQFLLGYWALRRRGRVKDPLSAWWRFHRQTLPICLIVPAFNEEKTIADNVRSLLALHYPEFEIVVVNDGSKDKTLDVLVEAFDLELAVRAHEPVLEHAPIRQFYSAQNYPKLLVIDKENGGKADALNAGINVARSPLVCAVDADSILEADALLRAVQPFVEDFDHIIAVGGSIRVANGCQVRHGRVRSIGLPTDALSLFQIVEYFRAFLIARLGWSELGAMMLISGAFGIFKGSILLQVGGYSRDLVGEDMEVIVKMHRVMAEGDNEYKMKFVPEPVCWTIAPNRLKDLGGQRKRWERGSLESFFKHRDMMGRPEYGLAGSVGYANILITDVLGPPLEILGYFTMPILYGLGMLNFDFFMAYLALTFVYGVFLSVGSLILAEMQLRRYPKPWHLLMLTLAAVLENFGYRQINNWWRVVGWVDYFRGKGGWGKIRREAFEKSG